MEGRYRRGGNRLLNIHRASLLSIFMIFCEADGGCRTDDSHGGEKPQRSLSRYLGSQSSKKGSTTPQQTSPITPASAINAPSRSQTASPSPSASAPTELKASASAQAEYKEISLPAVLRKRSIPSADTQRMVASASSNAVDLKAGQSILDQIGRPDHSGWMRKKGERYNSWKLRYFVLRGPHLYYLKSDSKAVRPSSIFSEFGMGWADGVWVGDEDQGIYQYAWV